MDRLFHAFRRAVSQPAFVVVSVILLVAAVSLSTATNYLQLHFRKLPVPLAKALDSVPLQMGPWMQVSIDEPLGHDIQETLGTDVYVFRDYIDTRLVSREEIAEFKDKTPGERRALARAIQMKTPQAVVRMSLTYYTGLVDTVAHVPDRCFVADGYEPRHYEIEQWPALKDLPGDKSVRYIVFEDQTPGRNALPVSVAYLFNCNAEYTSDSIGVRMRLADLFQKYGYYMKIELMTLNLPPRQGAEVMNEFLGHALPHVSGCLPDWEALQSNPAVTTAELK